MITRYGMSQRLGPVALSSGPPRDYSESTAHIVDDEIRSLIDAGYAHALSILSEHRTTLNRLAAALLEHETLDAAMLDDLFACSSL